MKLGYRRSVFAGIYCSIIEMSWIHCSHTLKPLVCHFRLLLSISRKENSTAFLLVLVGHSSLSISLGHCVQDKKSREETVSIDHYLGFLIWFKLRGGQMGIILSLSFSIHFIFKLCSFMTYFFLSPRPTSVFLLSDHSIPPFQKKPNPTVINLIS